jgi:hypothetical protein
MALTQAERSARYRLKNKDSPKFKARQVIKSRKKNNELKLNLINHYTNRELVCQCCGEPNYKFLTIQHIIDKKSIGHDRTHTGIKLLWWLKKHNYPEGFTVFCYNCNCGSDKNGGICPHKNV